MTGRRSNPGSPECGQFMEKRQAQNSRISAERLIIVRAGHVITANGTDQLAAARFEPLRAYRTVPRRIFGPICRMLAILQRYRGLHCSLYRLTEDLVCLPLRGAFHGWTVITYRVAREKLGRGGMADRLAGRDGGLERQGQDCEPAQATH